jgi:hypothetical protein
MLDILLLAYPRSPTIDDDTATAVAIYSAFLISSGRVMWFAFRLAARGVKD